MQEKKIVPQKFTNEFNDEGLTLHQLFLKTHHNLSLKAEEWYKIELGKFMYGDS